MKTVIKTEFERAYRSLGMKLSLLVGLTIALIQYVKQVLPWKNDIITYFDGRYITYPLSVFNMWLGADDTNPWLMIYLMLFPILASMAYGASYYDDVKSGYIKNVYTRIGKRKYLIAKYITVFVSAGSTVILPMLFNLMLTSAIMPSLVPSMNGLFAPGSVGMFSYIFYTRPYLYVTIYIIMYFIYGGVIASIALAVSKIARYRFIVLIIPFAIYYGTGLLSPFVRNEYVMEISLRRILAMTQYTSISEYTFFGEALVIGLISFVIYYVGGIKDDIF